MTQLFLDYQRSNKLFPWAGMILLLLSLGLLALADIYYQNLTERISYWELKSGQSQKATGRKTGNSPREINDMALEIKHANDVLNQITLPWDKLFQAVEWSSGKDVALLTIEPDAEKHVVKISGEAKNIEAVLNYVGHLSDQEIFNSVYLQSHQVQEQNPERPVRFALIATWKDTL
ncbi:PilN domain-containing protein [Sideroxydans sp. CL21]|uniref:PilN domain-containing protein n=1 Tax=Sideroxydans sp. CL21 TaxID=2600596 RepID=UPI0024BC7A79|nr:PilN domain-containing protein [Sideroxydans sp. CL21]